jgi:hypothetical protein
MSDTVTPERRTLRWIAMSRISPFPRGVKCVVDGGAET